MRKIYRALYTRCVNGVNFRAQHASNDGQKLFSTSGDMGLPNDMLSVLEKEVSRDVYGAGIRPYTNEVFRYLTVGETSALIHYRWMSREETGSREFFIAKALIGSFERHPAEYLSRDFFEKGDFFFDYCDAKGDKITEFKQLLTFKDNYIPPLFNALSESDLDSLGDSFPVVSFEAAGRFISQSEERTERLSAAVSHLIKQFGLPENERRGIVFKDTPENLRYWFAAIGYAFSARSAQKISFSIGMPPSGYSYWFATDALVGWDINDPDVSKSKPGSSPPSNLVFVENLPPAEREAYYNIISTFGAEHFAFISNFARQCGGIASFPEYCDDYSVFTKYRDALADFASGKTQDFSPDECLKRIKQYFAAGYLLPGFYSVILAAAEKYTVRSSDDIEKIIEIYNGVKKMIAKDLAGEGDEAVERAREQFNRSCVDCFHVIFNAILSDEYAFFNKPAAKDPCDYYNVLVSRDQDCAYEIALMLTQDEVFDGYSFDYAADDEAGLHYLTNVVYPRLSLIAFMMKWRQSGEPDYAMNSYSATYICKALNAALNCYPRIQDGDGGVTANPQAEHEPHIPPQDRAVIYENLFEPFLDAEAPINKSGAYGLEVYWDCAYEPVNISAHSYGDWLERITLHDWAARMAQSGGATVEDTIDKARTILYGCLENGISEHVLISLYLENIDYDERVSVFYYKNAAKLFATSTHVFLFKSIIVDALSKTFRTQRCSPRDGVCLSAVISILGELRKKDGKIWLECCELADVRLEKLFGLSNWEEHVANERLQAYAITDHLLENRLPASLRLDLYRAVSSYTGRERSPDSALIEDYLRHQKVFHGSSQPYKDALMRRIRNKRWSGAFYMQVFALFGFEMEVLTALFDLIEEKKTVSGEYAFVEFYTEFKKTYQVNKNHDGERKRKIVGLYTAFLTNIFDRTLQTNIITTADESFLELVVPLLTDLEKNDVNESAKYCVLADTHLGRVFDMQQWTEWVIDSGTVVCTVANYLIDKRLPSALMVSLYHALYHSGAKGYDLAGFLPYSAEFGNCGAQYHRQLAALLGKRQWGGLFFLQLMKLFVNDGAFSQEILRIASASKSDGGESEFCEFCREYVKERRVNHRKRQDEQASQLHKILLTVNLYFQSLKPSGLSAIIGNSAINEFEKAAKTDMNIAEMKELLSAISGKPPGSDKKAAGDPRKQSAAKNEPQPARPKKDDERKR